MRVSMYICKGLTRIAYLNVCVALCAFPPQKNQQEKEDFEWAMKMMNKDKIEAHKEEELLRAKMKQAYKVRAHVADLMMGRCGMQRPYQPRFDSLKFGSLDFPFPSSFLGWVCQTQSGDLATVKSIEYKLMTEEERERARYK